MHDCQKIQEKLFDLVLNETEPNEQKQILADATGCSMCQAELDALEKTLSLYQQGTAGNEPSAYEWQIYERNLQKQFAPQTKVSESFWQQIFFASIQVPAPVCAVAALLICAWAFFAFRPTKQVLPLNTSETVQTMAPNSLPNSAMATATPERIIVREERVITRKIYLGKRSNSVKRSKPIITQNPLDPDLSLLNLAEFKPVHPAPLSVVKENKPK
jgi:hypothetical protein